ncbi:MAG: histidine kinase [Chitinophagaceae bacterium]
MNLHCYRLPFFFIVFCFLIIKTEAQTLSFFHLTTAEGLSDNNVRSLAIDKRGFLWVGAEDGLNVYDGYTVTTYSKENYPQLAANLITRLLCDKNNNIWTATTEGVNRVDSKRNIYRVALQDSIYTFGCKAIVETKTLGVILFTNLGQFYQNKSSGTWELLKDIPAEFNYTRLREAKLLIDDKIFYLTDSLVMLRDYASGQLVRKYMFPKPISICKTGENEMAVGLESGLVMVMNIATGEIKKQYQLTNTIDGKTINIGIKEIQKASNGSLIIASSYKGLVVIDTVGTINYYIHSPFDQRSIVSSNTYRLLTGNNGEIIVGTTTSGLSMSNIYNRQVGFTGFFIDGKGNYTDNFIVNKITEDKNAVIWLSTLDRMIRWDKKNDKADFYYYYLQQPTAGVRSGDIRALCFDNDGRLWAGIYYEGLAIFNEATGQFKKIPLDTAAGRAVKDKFITDMILAADGNIWACSDSGIYTINTRSFAVDAFVNHPQLKEISGKRVTGLFEDSKKRIWIATNFYGVYCFDKEHNKLEHFTQRQGLASDITYMVREDKKGNFYIPNSKGFNVITNTGQIETYGIAKGTGYERCESVIVADDGSVWVSSKKVMMRFDLEKKSLETFDENNGFINEGYRVGNCYKMRSGEIIWGGYKGVNYFFPQQLENDLRPLAATIYKGSSTDTTFYFPANENISLPFARNNIAFQFVATQLGFARRIQYQYFLEGYDKEWQQAGTANQARYISLPSGKYTFKVKASPDGKNWTLAGNEVSVTIIAPLWQRWWFIAILISLITGIVYWFVQSRNKKIKEQKEEIETEQAINYFATSLSEQQSVDNILWDVARNCIGRLQFEDCVIYLLDEKRDELVQKAAHGPKSPKEYEIAKPIGIPIGKGIVGSVAFTGKAEIVEDTTKDARYIIDDQQRFSEITVPIVYNGKVLGVIDCEHSKKRFFTQKHLSILTTIASLCANKIMRVKAEEEKQKAQNILMDAQQKMTEVEMQALRAQMNPHFIFNCLNSINRYIVKSDQATASLYLTRFAKLIRLILDNSNSKNVILSNELEALKLYIEMEALRFDKKFAYEIIVDNNVNPDSIEVPPLIIQPYVENAIWHGLLHKERGGKLSIRMKMIGDSVLQCEVEDNGVGRDKAQELKSKSAISRKSLGMKLTQDRLSLLNKHAELNASVDIIDLKEEDGESLGTKVVVKIPV